MIYQLKVILIDSQQFGIEIEVDRKQTFLELHLALQKSLGLPPCQMASFFATFYNGRKKFEISEVEMGSNKAPCYSMRRTRVGDIISQKSPFIHYTYDFFNDRSLIMELTGINMEKNLREPKVKINGTDSQVHLLQEIIADDFSLDVEKAKPSSDYGVADDYYEIFGDIEEFTV
jgi:hypothetical protein